MAVFFFLFKCKPMNLKEFGIANLLFCSTKQENKSWFFEMAAMTFPCNRHLLCLCEFTNSFVNVFSIIWLVVLSLISIYIYLRLFRNLLLLWNIKKKEKKEKKKKEKKELIFLQCNHCLFIQKSLETEPAVVAEWSKASYCNFK